MGMILAFFYIVERTCESKDFLKSKVIALARLTAHFIRTLGDTIATGVYATGGTHSLTHLNKT